MDTTQGGASAPQPTTERCNHISLAKGHCTLPAGHPGPHVWERPDGVLTPAQQALWDRSQKITGENKG